MIYPTGKIVVIIDGIGWRWGKRGSTNGTNCTSQEWFANYRDCVKAAKAVAVAYNILYGGDNV